VLEEPFDYRSVYLPVIRGIIPEPLKLFDFPEPSNVQGARDANTTAKQSLFLMNSPRIIRIAERFGQDLLDQPSHPTDREKVELAYLRCFGQPPSDPQADRALRFIGQMGGVSDHAEARQDAWTAFCQSLIASARFRFID
jgi:hypothetical protein